MTVRNAPPRPPRRRVWLAAAAAAPMALAGCTDAQIAAWAAWHQQDPAAALAHAHHPDVVAAFEARDTRQLTDRHGARWDDIAWCESGGRWDHPPVTNRTGTYSGGVMIGHRWWPLYGGHEYAAQPWQASRAEQIEIAERILDDNGWDAWDCA